jgi:hypothetical protein
LICRMLTTRRNRSVPELTYPSSPPNDRGNGRLTALAATWLPPLRAAVLVSWSAQSADLRSLDELITVHWAAKITDG